MHDSPKDPKIAELPKPLQKHQVVKMDIVYAAEKSTIADVLSNRLHDRVKPQEIEVHENPDETGSFLVTWRRNHYVVSPSGNVKPDSLN
jgi:hypothetical protein